ncbi:O-antigen ligase family protein [Butyrivibrio sp. MC2021]|uniref:O-antigen ligase family protein n=1 Tax=Butyrivibrio sp. MC2021 TaxID=1408306 RepID=UPI00047CB33B|nr:O-antigen ligase family protein [Butyrivibrio sp. MC2021]
MKYSFGFKKLEWYIYILTLVVMLFSTQYYFGTDSYSRVYRLNAVCIIFFLFFSLLANNFKFKYHHSELFAYGIALAPYIYQVICSLLFFGLYKKITFRNLLHYNLQPLLVCIMAIVAYITFSKKALKGILIAAVLNYLVYIFVCIVKFGPLSLLEAGTNTSASRLLEVHELTFIFGLSIVYLMVLEYFKEKSVNRIWLILLTIFCLLGFKRILLFAMIISAVIYWIFKRCKRPTILICLSLFLIAISLIWVYVCSSWDILTGLSIKYNVDLSGRNWIYSNFYPYYEYSLSYIGAGIGYVQQLIGQMSTMVSGGHQIGLHNEYLRLYIELGFLPYIGYFVLLIPLVIYVIYKKVDMQTAVLYFSLWLVTLICIATDNLLAYPNYMLTSNILIITSVCNGRKNKLLNNRFASEDN